MKNQINPQEVIIDEKKRKEYIESFKKEKNNPENLELAEMGLEDFLKMIDEWEKNK